MLRLTSVSEAPDIYLAVFAQGESTPGLAGVDDQQFQPMASNKAFCLEYPKQGSQVVQIFDAHPTEGAKVSLIEKDRNTGGYLLSLWSLK